MSTESEILALEAEKQAGTDIFYAQQQMVDSLTELIDQRNNETVIVSPPATEPARTTPSYLVYVAAGLGVLLVVMFIKKKKR